MACMKLTAEKSINSAFYGSTFQCPPIGDYDHIEYSQTPDSVPTCAWFQFDRAYACACFFIYVNAQSDLPVRGTSEFVDVLAIVYLRKIWSHRSSNNAPPESACTNQWKHVCVRWYNDWLCECPVHWKIMIHFGKVVIALLIILKMMKSTGTMNMVNSDDVFDVHNQGQMLLRINQKNTFVKRNRFWLLAPLNFTVTYVRKQTVVKQIRS